MGQRNYITQQPCVRPCIYVTFLLIWCSLQSIVALQFQYGGRIPLPYPSHSIDHGSLHHLPLSSSTVIPDQPSSALPTVAPAQPEIQDEAIEIDLNHQKNSEASAETFVTDAVRVDNQVEEDMKGVKTKVTIGILSTLISYLSLNSLLRTTHPEAFVWIDEDREDSKWIASSKSWVDRKVCRWLGVCGGTHLRFIGKRFGRRIPNSQDDSGVDGDYDWDWQNAWTEGKDRPEDWTDDERVLRKIPHYVLEYAPLVHLYSQEQFWPCDIAEHLYHITPTLNYTPLQSEKQHPTLTNLDDLNEWDRGRWIFLTSNDDVEKRPKWLEGEKNIPVVPSGLHQQEDDGENWIHTPGRTYTQSFKDTITDIKEWFAPGLDQIVLQDDLKQSQSKLPKVSSRKGKGHHRLALRDDSERKQASPIAKNQLRGGRSNAPAVLITVNKGHGVVDAFWFFFYSFNLGNVVFQVRFGNHVGDWEHTAIRFHHGKPKAVFFSEHNFGSAYGYDAVEKLGKRPVIYSASGTHAMYATPGGHPYILPRGILHDQTDRGPLWDPALNSHMFTYDYKNHTLRSSDLTPSAPTGWFDFAGHWGDKFYPLGDKRQYRVLGQYHYVNGPLGPKFKNLGRKKICAGPEAAKCVIKHWVGMSNMPGFWNGDDGNGISGPEEFGGYQ